MASDSQALSDERIAEALDWYGFAPSAEFCEKLRTYVSLLLRWNGRISLTTITAVPDILRYHFGESLFAVSAAQIENGRLADVGSGAGFPGAAIAMAVPAIEVTLIEANAKKAAFLSEIKRELKLDNVQVYHGRHESMPQGKSYDFLTARAVGEYGKLLSQAGELLAERGKAILWLGGGQIQELEAMSAWRWERPVEIPRTRRRFLLIGSAEAL